MIGIEIWKYESSCWKCDSSTPIVYPRGLGGFGGGTWGLVGEQLTSKKYCNVDHTYSKTQGRKVYGNICIDCGAYQGNHFVHEHIFDSVAAYQSWEKAKRDYEVVDIIDVSYPCEDCGVELTYKKSPRLCKECELQREIDASIGEKTDLEYCEVCEGILHPEHRADHHTSYTDNETITVCDSCHAKIHHQSGFREDLEPEMSRREAEEGGFI